MEVWRFWKFGRFGGFLLHLHTWVPEASADLARLEVLDVWRVCCLSGTSTCSEARGLAGSSLFWGFGGLEGLLQSRYI